jgi:hypothetical protein
MPPRAGGERVGLVCLTALALAGCGRDPVFPDLPAGPQIAISTPTRQDHYSTYLRSLRIAGTVTGAQVVRWTNSGNSTSGVATLDRGTWTVELAGLAVGQNPVTLYADADGRGRSVGTASLLIVYDPRLDPEPPVLIITFPTDQQDYVTSNTVIVLGGRAADNSGLFDVVWSNTATGQHGLALGHEEWQASVPLIPGANPIFVTAVDWGGKSDMDSVKVTRTSAGSISRGAALRPDGTAGGGARSPERTQSGIVPGRPRAGRRRPAAIETAPRAFGWRLSEVGLAS